MSRPPRRIDITATIASIGKGRRVSHAEAAALGYGQSKPKATKANGKP